jgi:hypothetical protein
MPTFLLELDLLERGIMSIVPNLGPVMAKGFMLAI